MAAPSPQQWEENKNAILDLYLSKRLSEVMEIMKQKPEFTKATERMYKRKFKEWKVRKNRKRQRSFGASASSPINGFTAPAKSDLSQSLREPKGPIHGPRALHLSRFPIAPAGFREPEAPEQDSFRTSALSDIIGFTLSHTPISNSPQSLQESNGLTYGPGTLQRYQSPITSAHFRISEAAEQDSFGPSASPDINGLTPCSIPRSDSLQSPREPNGLTQPPVGFRISELVEQGSPGTLASSDVGGFTPARVPKYDSPQSIREPNGLTHGTGALQLYQSPMGPARFRISVTPEQDSFGTSALSDTNGSTPPCAPISDSPHSLREPSALIYGAGTLQLCRSPITPSSSRIPGFFNQIDIYFQSFRDSMPQSLSLPMRLEPSLEHQNACMDLFDSACWFLSKRKVDKGLKFLRQFSDAFRRMGKRHPSLITLPLQILDEFSNLRDRNKAEQMLWYISQIFTEQLGESHPISLICQLLRRFPDRYELLQPGIELISQRSLEVFGQTNPHTLDVQEVHNFIVMSKGNLSDAEAQVQDLLNVCEPILGINHEAILQFRNQLALLLLKQGRYAEAEEVVCLNLVNLGFSCNQLQHKNEFLFSLRYLHHALRAQDKNKLAEVLLRGALRLTLDIHKGEHFITEILSDELQEMLRSQEKGGEADYVSQMSLSKLRKSYLAEDWNEERAKLWAYTEGEEVFKYYPYEHTMYCGCRLWTMKDVEKGEIQCGQLAGIGETAFQ